MARSQLEQSQASGQPEHQPMANPAEAAAITVLPKAALFPEPRPRWLRWLAIAAVTGSVGGLVWLLWWLFLRTPPRSYVLDLSPSASQYAITDQKTPLLNWEISHPRQVDTLILRTLTADGALVGEPREYDLSGSLPVELLAYCQQTRQRLTCQNVPTDLLEPGQYRFELTLLPRAVLNQAPMQASSSLVTITDLPTPIALELAPQQVIYSEAGTQVTPNTPNLAPPVTQGGIQVSWIVTHPEALQDLLLVVREPGGTSLGGRRFTFRSSQNSSRVTIPEELKSFCRLGDTLICEGVPTGMTEVGKYQFELTPIPVNMGDEDFPTAKVSEVVEIQPRPVRIAAFTINGREAEPKYLVPVDQGQPIPGFRIGWRVEGGSTTKVELLPSPGNVDLEGVLPLPLTPAGTTTLTLRVTDGQNPPLIRAVTIETFDPTPNTPVIVNPGNQGQSGQSTPRPTQPTPQPPTTPPATRPTRPNGDLPGSSLQDSQAEDETPSNLPEDLRNPEPDDLNLKF
ncbi:MAG: hypothetical protein HC929_07835 [Leptolyngbyaceae cyanobacterium SM2_5_2]|nr:hypothetical protein [Leptolyngbyaceae cyanobacterium SM2_5_2]